MDKVGQLITALAPHNMTGGAEIVIGLVIVVIVYMTVKQNKRG